MPPLILLLKFLTLGLGWSRVSSFLVDPQTHLRPVDPARILFHSGRAPLVRTRPTSERSLSLWKLQVSPYSEGYSEREVREMEDLIISLSQEATDQSRRDRVSALFLEVLAKPNGAPKRFCSLFDEVLVMVGDRVKLQAQEKALALQQEQPPALAAEDDGQPSLDPIPIETTAEGWQLWALIDMMVQSKTIVKKANGELGNEGAFG